MKIYCMVCGKQAVEDYVPLSYQRITTIKGAKAGFKQGECICGHCAKDLDENGLFPEEYAFIHDIGD